MKKLLIIISLIVVFSLTGCGENNKPLIVNDIECLKHEGVEIPKVLGETFRTAEEVKELIDKSDSNIMSEINYGEAITYLKNYYYSKKNEGVVSKAAELINGFYDDVGTISIYYEPLGEYKVLYILDDNVYYVFDTYNEVINESSWLAEFNGIKGYGSDIEELASNLQANCKPLSNKKISSHEITSLTDVEIYVYHQMEIPKGTGLPKLSDEYIDELIASEDYERIAREIETLADCVNYFVRADFVFGDGLLWDYPTTCSAIQTMQRRAGQCASMSSCMNYILKGDYDEVGYIKLDGHLMLYIVEDGVYYAVNPVAYTRAEDREKAGYRDIKYYPETRDGISEDFQFIADGIARDFAGSSGSSYVITYSWDKSITLLDNTFPVGSKPICWVGNLNIREKEFQDEVYNNDYINNEEDIVMFLSDMADILGKYEPRSTYKYYRGW